MNKPSYLFETFVKQFPASFPAHEYKRHGNECRNISGEFVMHLYDGDIFKAANVADQNHRVLLAKLVFPEFYRA